MASNDQTTAAAAPDAQRWWRHAVCYQVYVRSFADSDGDGLGDLRGITSRLGHLRDLGVDAVWLTPFYRSPQHDHGYDVADHTDVDPLFGDLADFDGLLDRAHAIGLRVIVDLVPNHTSSEHPWFQEALAAAPGSPERARYVFAEGAGSEPPNNWASVFGGPAWTRLPDGQWYLHLFDHTQPDLNWRNPEVRAMFADVLRFWLDRGVDGFRIDVAHGLFKDASLRDQELPDGVAPTSDMQGMVASGVVDEPMWEQPELHDVYRHWHTILAGYDDRMAVAEAWVRTPESMARLVRPDELQQTFNFAWLLADYAADSFAEVIRDSIEALAPTGALPTWVLSNHDEPRHVTRYGGGARGLARGRAATLTMLALPGSAYLYQGEELGLEQADVPVEHRQDPRALAGEVGRDGSRVPIPWGGSAPPYDFGPGAGQPWIPQPEDWAAKTVAAQADDPESVLSFYRAALAARRRLLAAGGGSEAGEEVTELVSDNDLLSFRRGPLRVLLNCGDSSVPMPAGQVVLASGPVAEELPPDTAVWLRD